MRTIAFLLLLNTFCFGQNALLNPTYFDKLLGDYETNNKELIVIGRSQTRLYAFFEKNQVYRGLKKVNDTT